MSIISVAKVLYLHVYFHLTQRQMSFLCQRRPKNNRDGAQTFSTNTIFYDPNKREILNQILY